MEVRGGERLAYLAVLFSVFCARLTLGKYVRGVINTKEVSDSTVIILGSLISCDSGGGTLKAAGSGHAGVSVTDTAEDILFFAVKLRRILTPRHRERVCLRFALKLRAICVRVISGGACFTVAPMNFGTVPAPARIVPLVYREPALTNPFSRLLTAVFVSSYGASLCAKMPVCGRGQPLQVCVIWPLERSASR